MMFTIQDLLLKLPIILEINRNSSLTTFLKTCLINLKYSYVFFFSFRCTVYTSRYFWVIISNKVANG